MQSEGGAGRESPLSLSSRLVGKGERGRGPAGSEGGSVLEELSTQPPEEGLGRALHLSSDSY